jgi:hypothetical protein
MLYIHMFPCPLRARIPLDRPLGMQATSRCQGSKDQEELALVLGALATQRQDTQKSSLQLLVKCNVRIRHWLLDNGAFFKTRRSFGDGAVLES